MLQRLKTELYIIEVIMLLVLPSLLFTGCSHAPTEPSTLPKKSPPTQEASQSANASSNTQSPMYLCENISRYINKQVGSGECVDLLKVCANTPNTQHWRKGQRVWKNAIPTGTAIATFKRSRYPNKSGYHAAIYVSQDDNGIYVWDQWRGQSVHLRRIRFDQARKQPGNDATQYHVITQ